jgi:hypothetical protein
VEDPNESKDEYLAPSELMVQRSNFEVLKTLYAEAGLESEGWVHECLDIIESRKSIEYKEMACCGLICYLTDGKMEERLKSWSPQVLSALSDFLQNQVASNSNLN